MYLRIWTPTTSSSSNDTADSWILWDQGNIQWELRGSIFRHFKICSRRKEGEKILEYVEPLEEVPVPLGLVSRQIVGSQWSLQEEVVQPQIKPLSHKEVKQTNNSPPLPSVKESSLGKQQQEDLESQVTVLSQSSYILPNELWSSLSQWIPPYALFQPSLHYLASLELSDTPVRPSYPQSAQAVYSQPAQARHQSKGLHQHSKPYRPKTSSHAFQENRPLFVL
jgi:hypothetical protein